MMGQEEKTGLRCHINPSSSRWDIAVWNKESNQLTNTSSISCVLLLLAMLLFISLNIVFSVQERWGKTAAVETPKHLPDQPQQRSERCISHCTSLLLFPLPFIEQRERNLHTQMHGLSPCYPSVIFASFKFGPQLFSTSFPSCRVHVSTFWHS